MTINDTQKDILDKATDQLFSIIWREISQSFTAERLKEERLKFLDLDVFGCIIQNSYDVEQYKQPTFLTNLEKACSSIYPKGDFSKTPLYTAAIGLRKIWEGDQNYLYSKDVQLDSIKGMTLPTGQEIRLLLQDKMKCTTTALLQAREQTDFNAKVAYVNGILNREYVMVPEEALAKAK